MTDVNIVGADLTGMGARYWYATMCKVAQSLLSRLVAGEDVADEAAVVVAAMRAGPWATIEADYRAVLRLAAPPTDAPPPPKAHTSMEWEWREIRGAKFLRFTDVSPRAANVVSRVDAFIDALLAEHPELVPFPCAVDNYARLEQTVAELESAVADGHLNDSVTKHLLAFARLRDKARAQLLIDR